MKGLYRRRWCEQSQDEQDKPPRRLTALQLNGVGLGLIAPELPPLVFSTIARPSSAHFYSCSCFARNDEQPWNESNTRPGRHGVHAQSSRSGQ
jgi:hypothetical protein